jgi:8-oxo-dGTP pyrophosphatase MutT (NUDIX family)
MGKYKKNDDKYLKYLFNNMSFSEKIDIISMQFSQMWYRVWLNNPEKYFNITDVYKSTNFSNCPIEERFTNAEINKIYYEKKNKFEANFSYDNGKRLRTLIQQSTDSEILWEIPKGGKNKKDNSLFETDIECAIREFYEETRIDYTKYNLLYNVKPVIDSFVDDNVNYQSIYYIAALKDNNKLTNPHIDFRNFNQITEVEQIKWVSLPEVKFLNLSKPIHNKIITLYSKITHEFKKYNKALRI